uniref:Uncharacterized protein n=1 Tax=Trichogramma kaykai TaxID=54128 RepID=A0ABD2WFN0_9HYME
MYFYRADNARVQVDFHRAISQHVARSVKRDNYYRYRESTAARGKQSLARSAELDHIESRISRAPGRSAECI